MASARPGRVGKAEGIPSPFAVLNLVMCDDGVDRWVLVDHGTEVEVEASAVTRQRFVERMDAEAALGARDARSPDALPPMFTAMPTVEAVELLAGNTPRTAVSSPTAVRLR